MRDPSLVFLAQDDFVTREKLILLVTFRADLVGLSFDFATAQKLDFVRRQKRLDWQALLARDDRKTPRWLIGPEMEITAIEPN
jgi:hypothetical protein